MSEYLNLTVTLIKFLKGFSLLVSLIGLFSLHNCYFSIMLYFVDELDIRVPSMAAHATLYGCRRENFLISFRIIYGKCAQCILTM